MDKPVTSRVRQCTVCGGNITYPVLPDERRHSCVSIGDQLLSEIPPECWQNSNNKIATELLSAIPSHFIYIEASRIPHQKRLEISSLILEATKEKMPVPEFWLGLMDQFGKRFYKQFYSHLPESSNIKAVMKPSIDSLIKVKKERVVKEKVAKIERIPVEPIQLPGEFQRAVNAFEAAGIRRYELKIQRGHNYQLDTIKRRTADATHFCEFLTLRGHQFWPEVGQHDLDEYVDSHSRHAGAHAFTFLKFLKQKFKLTQKFIRPRNKHATITESVATINNMREVIIKVAQYDDPQVVAAALLLLLYAQPLTRTMKLKGNNFKRANGKLFVKFAEEWTPVDALTEKFLCSFYPDMRDSDFAGSEKPLLTYSTAKMGYEINKIVKTSLKPLRLGAIANLIRSGITDRISISRILGVSMPTVVLVEKTFQWDLQSTVSPEIIASRNEVIRGERTE
jgi:hypothetical protein